MAWGPAGEHTEEERPATRQELEESYAKYGWEDMRVFLDMLRPEDEPELRFWRRGNNHRRAYGYTFRRGQVRVTLVQGTMMS
jgi:hypothetical protein